MKEHLPASFLPLASMQHSDQEIFQAEFLIQYRYTTLQMRQQKQWHVQCSPSVKYPAPVKLAQEFVAGKIITAIVKLACIPLIIPDIECV
ncbi:predicted protein [Botrytis cinerea T4]|uniref:Uncharacterized protein n=1 Tax=Botryotinia fuckeliana (strain T4) TaxID=999810 RepID=G2YNR7_BOTF4|nr:predicted protein [Botrytis cinerea T4]